MTSEVMEKMGAEICGSADAPAEWSQRSSDDGLRYFL
jgi:hypothetical protein